MMAISTVIASILMLMIVIALSGTAYIYISGTFTGKTSTTFELVESVNDTVTIRNSGTEPLTRITAILDGSTANMGIVPNIQGMVALWSFNDGTPSQIVRDSSDNKNHGTLGSTSTPDTNDPTWVTGRFGNALQFDGINDYVDLGTGNSLAFTSQNFTIEAWINRAGNPGSGATAYVFNRGTDRNDGYTLHITNTGRIGFYTQQSGTEQSSDTNSGVIVDGIWSHIVVVRAGAVATFYKDGLEVPKLNNASHLNPVAVGGRVAYIGHYDTSNFRQFNGTIDEVRIYNRALSESEIKQLYSGLVAPGQLATVTPLTSLSKGTHTLRLCTSSMCNTAILTVN